jgi:hypothetical protein
MLDMPIYVSRPDIHTISAAIQEVEVQLQANDAEIALSLSLYIIFQGSAPNFWAAVTEIKGRKVRASIANECGVINRNSLVGCVSNFLHPLYCELRRLRCGEFCPSFDWNESAPGNWVSPQILVKEFA